MGSLAEQGDGVLDEARNADISHADGSRVNGSAEALGGGNESSGARSPFHSEQSSHIHQHLVFTDPVALRSGSRSLSVGP